MATTLHTFADIFGSAIQTDNGTVSIRKIVIPIIQRDYAQGRTDAAASRIRERFLNSLFGAVCGQPVTLDFVYGDVSDSGELTLLDGQQRLTTLFLLHWYAAKKEKIAKEQYAFLQYFSYETRYSAREFCNRLVDFQPSLDKSVSEEIIDQPWFPLEWKKDSTIGGMLVMLDAIDDKFRGLNGLWDKLIGGAIRFYFLPIRDMGLTDELYIKMNSRGKPLTLFEHFKAELEQTVQIADPSATKRIMSEIDCDWTDMLWQYRNGDNLIDDAFLHYFHFICDILCYQSGGTPQTKSTDAFEMLEEYFGKKNAHASENLRTLEQFFNCWRNLPEENPAKFLDRFFSYDHAVGKVRLDGRYSIDIFADCLQKYADRINERNRQFPLHRTVMLYAVTDYLRNRGAVTEEDLRRRLRIIHNLIQNSPDEISDSENRMGGNRMPAILRQVDSIMLQGAIDQTIERSFNQMQIMEEIDKMQWCMDNPDKTESLFYLEDHPILTGQIGIIGLERPELFPRFISLFECDKDLIDCALMTIADYSQAERNGWRHQLGSSKNDSAWKNLFHKSRNTGYERTAHALRTLLSKTDVFTDEFLGGLIKDYLDACEKEQHYEWRYYYVKYPSFRPGRFGKYSWQNFETKPYEMLMMWTEFAWSSNSRQPFLYEIDKNNLDRDDCGQRLKYKDSYILCEQTAFVEKKLSDGMEIRRIEIKQDAAGIDREDRILVGRAWLGRGFADDGE